MNQEINSEDDVMEGKIFPSVHICFSYCVHITHSFLYSVPPQVVTQLCYPAGVIQQVSTGPKDWRSHFEEAYKSLGFKCKPFLSNSEVVMSVFADLQSLYSPFSVTLQVVGICAPRHFSFTRLICL